MRVCKAMLGIAVVVFSETLGWIPVVALKFFSNKSI